MIGQKWAGAFPTYSADGYWDSHGTNVLPQSLYLQQLQERLAPEGPGGLITTLNFGVTNLGTMPRDSVNLIVRRTGVLDGSRPVQLVLAPEHRKLFTPESLEVPMVFPANTNAISFQFTVRSNAYLPLPRAVTVQIVHVPGYSAGVSNVAHFVLPARPVQIAQWREHYFDETQLLDPSISGNFATPANDFVPNILKYAFGISPWEPSELDDFPAATLQDGRLTLVYERNKWLTDLVFIPRVTSNLTHWSSHPDDLEIVEILDLGNFERRTMKDRSSILTAPHRFMELQVEVAP